MRFTVVSSLATILFAYSIGLRVALADDQPSPLPSVQPTAQSSAQPSVALSDQEIRDLLVGKQFSRWDNSTQYMVQLKADGTVYAYIISGYIPRPPFGASDTGTYKITDGHVCITYNSWQRAKTNCRKAARKGQDYYLDAVLIQVSSDKK
jgi:hypothetical protein